MTIRTGKQAITWRLVTDPPSDDPDNLLDVSRQEIAQAIADCESSGQVVEDVLYDDQDVSKERLDTDGVEPDPEDER